MTLSALAAVRRAAAKLLPSAAASYRPIMSRLQGAQQQTRRTPLLLSNDVENRRTDDGRQTVA